MDIKGFDDKNGPTSDKFQIDNPTETSLLVHTFEEAVALTGTGMFHYRLLLTCGLCFLTIMSHVLVMGIILPSIKCDLPATIEEQGLLVSCGFFGVVCCSHAMGFLGDTWGRVLTLKWSVILSSIVGVISAFSVNVWMLIITRFLTGFLAGACQACVYSFCGEFHSKKTRARHVTIVSAFSSFPIVTVPIFAMIILPLHINFNIMGLMMTPWRILLLANNIVPAVALVFLCFTPETPKYDLMHNNHDKALNTMRKMFTANTGRPMEEYPVHHIEMETGGASISDIHGLKDAVKMIWNQTAPLFYKEHIWHTLNISFILFMTYGISHGVFVWYPTIIIDEIKRDGEDLCLVISEVDVIEPDRTSVCNGQMDVLSFWLIVFLGAVSTLLYIVFGFIIHIVGKRRLLILWLIICDLCCVAMHWISSLPLAVLALTLIVSVFNCAGVVGTIAVEFYPTNISAMAMCFIVMVGRLGAVAGSNIFGLFLFDHCDCVFWVLVAVLIPITILSYFLPEKKHGKSLPTNQKLHNVVAPIHQAR